MLAQTVAVAIAAIDIRLACVAHRTAGTALIEQAEITATVGVLAASTLMRQARVGAREGRFVANSAAAIRILRAILASLAARADAVGHVADARAAVREAEASFASIIADTM